MRRGLWVGAVLTLGLATAMAVYRPDRALRVATGAVAHDLCAAAFVQQIDPDRVFAESLRPRAGLERIAGLIRYRVDRAAGLVDVSVSGAARMRAAYRPGWGCLVLHDPVVAPPAFPAGPASPPPAPIEPGAARLAAALDRAFAEDGPGPPRRTKAIVVLRDGQVVAERYAPGYTAATPLPGFSLAKSLMNALIGAAVAQRRLDPAAPAPVPAWANDARRAITLEQLMRMTAGLALDETGSGFDPSNQMLYLARDMAGFAADAALADPPGTRWNYSSGMTQLAARILRDAVGGTGTDMLAFAGSALFAPLGITGMTIEMDATGTPIGANYVFAPARDWARLGQLFLDDGVADGRRLLPPGWVAWSTRPTLDSDYGAGFWVNASGHAHARGRVRRGMPEDAFFGSGNLGQRLAVLPSQRLVVARFGYATGEDGDIAGFTRLIADLVAASPSG